MSAVSLARRCDSCSMASGSSRRRRRARYCSSAWLRFSRFSRCNSASASASTRKAGLSAGDRLDLGVGELLAADVLGAAGGVVAGHHPRDEAGLGLESLPHVGVERAFGDVAVDRHLLVLVLLTQDAAVALFYFRRFPGGVQVVQRHEAFLHVGAGAHLLRAADQHPHRAGPDLLEEGQLLGVGVGVAGGGDLARGMPRATSLPITSS